MTHSALHTEDKKENGRDITGSGRKNILVVDDEEIVRSIITDCLPEYGFSIIMTDRGEKALRIFKKAPESIDLVILDRVMPGMSGLDLFNKIKEIKPGQKVILLTGYVLPSDIKEMKSIGLHFIIKKPFNLDEFISGIHAALV